MTRQFLLDTNIFILLFNNRLAEPIPQGVLAYSVITEIELLSFNRLSPDDEKLIRSQLPVLRRVDLDTDVIQETISLRRQYGFKTPDAIVVASAFVSDSVLITNDQKLLNIRDLQTQTLAIH